MDDFKRFKIIRKLGSGGMGDVFQAHDPNLDTKVALKVFKPGQDDDISSDFFKRFVFEAQILAKLNHPYIVRIFEVGPSAKNPYISMEYVEGMTLRDYIYKEEDQSDEEKKRIVTEVLLALAEIHKAGIVHRDIKPDNIMIDKHGHVRLMDFGIVKSADVSITQTNLIIGTPAYMSPEQIEGIKEIDGRSDLFSFASVIYELFTKQKAFKANSQTGVIKKVMMDSFDKFNNLDKTFSSDFRHFLEKAFEKEPDDRFATAEDMLKEWDKVDLRHGIRLSSTKSWIFFTIVFLLFVSSLNGLRINRRKLFKRTLSNAGMTKYHFQRMKDKRTNFFTGNFRAYAVANFSNLHNSGIITGYAVDFDKPDQPLNLILFADGKPIANFKTKVYRQDINQGADISGDHGYRYTIPKKFRDKELVLKVEDANTLQLFTADCHSKDEENCSF